LAEQMSLAMAEVLARKKMIAAVLVLKEMIAEQMSLAMAAVLVLKEMIEFLEHQLERLVQNILCLQYQ
jgi:uncharacterized protein YaaW (UPF0174 family)